MKERRWLLLRRSSVIDFPYEGCGYMHVGRSLMIDLIFLFFIFHDIYLLQSSTAACYDIKNNKNKNNLSSQ